MNNENLLDEEISKAKKSFGTERMDMSIGELANLYNEGEIIINPEYQRCFRWEDYQKTRLIESLLVDIPIPPIFVIQNEDNVWELVDGLQRVSTFLSFMGVLKDDSNTLNNWALSEGDILKNIKGLKFNDLSNKIKIKIKRSVCRVEIMNSLTDYNLRYELFERLNTGGSSLTDQEIRNVVYRGTSENFNNFLRDKGQDINFLNIINISESKEKKLFADELVLRFCSLYKNKNITKVLSNHMNDFMKKIVEETQKNTEKITKYSEIFDKTVFYLSQLDDNQIFIPKSKKGGFSTSIYDGIMIGLSENIDLYDNKDHDIILEKINLLKSNKDFQENMGSSSHNPNKVLKRIEIANDIFGSID